jgi:POTRA domain, FtsQ-type
LKSKGKKITLHFSSKETIAFSKAVLWIFLSTLFVSGSAFMAWLYYLHVKEVRYHDEQYHIVAIVQDTSSNESVKTMALAEILQLSLNEPTNLYEFNTKEAVEKLLKCPVIKNAIVKKILPGTLYIQYEMRTPVAYVGDFTNTFIDEEGILFPSCPFYSSKRLPIFYLGLQEGEKWGNCVEKNTGFQLAMEVNRKFNELVDQDYRIRQLDTMQCNADSYGKRQIVLLVDEYFEHQVNPMYVRLNVENYKEGVYNFHTLLSSVLNKKGMTREKGKEVVVDLRVQQLAFLSF